MVHAEVLPLFLINKAIEHVIKQLIQNNRLCQIMTLYASCVVIRGVEYH